MKQKDVSKEKTDLQIKRLNKLFKELTLMDEQKISVETLLQQSVDSIVSLWIKKNEISAKIEYERKTYLSEPFKETSNSIKSTAQVRGKDLNLELFHPETHPFTEAEEDVADLLANKLVVKVNRILAHEELEENQELLKKAYKLARIGTWNYDTINEKLHWSEVTKEVHGFGPDYDPDVESTIMLFKEGYDRDTFAQAARDAIEKQKPFDLELKIISGKGDERWVRATGEAEYKDGICTRFYGISQNVTDRREAEEEVALNDRRFKALVKHGREIIAIIDKEANVDFISQTLEKVLGYPPDFFIGRNALEHIHAEDKDRVYRQLTTLEPMDTAQLKPFRFKNSDGDWRWMEASITNLADDPAVKGYVINARDVTERKLKQEEVLDSLKEKQTLLAEIHHRIKNNLSVLTGLLQLQASKEHNEEVLERLFDSVARIQTMASIHEQLYQSNDFANIELADRLQLLIMNIKKGFQTETDVELNFQCEHIELPFSRALPCSLIANEVVTNIFKHAFKGKSSGKITIELAATDVDGYARMTIKDNGVGLPKDFNPAESSSLGLTLINMLSDQLPAEYDFQSSENGTTFNLLFRVN